MQDPILAAIIASQSEPVAARGERWPTASQHLENLHQLSTAMLEMEEAQLRKAADGSEHKEAEVSTVPYWFSWSVGST